MLLALQLFADAAPEAQTAPPGSSLTFLVPLLCMFLLFYLLMVRPARRQEQERRSMLDALKKNDKVITSGGLIGIVAAIKDKEDEVTLKVDESSNVRLRVLKSSIIRVVGPEESAKETKEGQGS